VCDDQSNKARLVITRASEARVLITPGEGGKVRFLISRQVTGEVSDQVMEARLVISDSTIMFCCIMFNAMFVVVK